jgi:hypothetical protein
MIFVIFFCQENGEKWRKMAKNGENGEKLALFAQAIA